MNNFSGNEGALSVCQTLTVIYKKKTLKYPVFIYPLDYLVNQIDKNTKKKKL